jgi:hypothetical protein
LFQPGSNLAESLIKPEIFAAGVRVDQLIATVQQTTTQLVPAVKSSNKTRIARRLRRRQQRLQCLSQQVRKEE